MGLANNQILITIIRFGEMLVAPKVHYTICPRGGYHTGEVLNMVCLEPKCQNSQLCCCACVEETHKDHNTKPLRVVMLQAQQAAQKVVPVNFNIQVALDLLAKHQQQSIEIFAKHKTQFSKAIQQIQDSLDEFYRFLVNQVTLKNIDPKVEIQKAFEIVQSDTAKENDYVGAVKRISELVVVKKEDRVLTEGDIISSLNTSSEEMKKRLQISVQQVGKQLQKYHKQLNQSFKSDALWKQGNSYKFSATLKHPDIKVISEHLVKSANNSGYKFAIMEPNLEVSGPVKKFVFQIKESLSNWIAVGMCHSKIVANKNYGFNFSSIGHGAYMVSANGGIWSHTKAEHNNSVKAFKFVKGDIIQVTANFTDKIVTFQKGSENYQIPFETITDDQLTPCVLFYYLNDEVEFLPDLKE